MKWRRNWSNGRRWRRNQLIARDGSICPLCHEPFANMKQMTLDHIIPASKGGTDELDNQQLAHRDCNQTKADMLPEEFTAWQLREGFTF